MAPSHRTLTPAPSETSKTPANHGCWRQGEGEPVCAERRLMFSARCGRSAESPGVSDRMPVQTHAAYDQHSQTLYASLSLRVGSSLLRFEIELLLRAGLQWPSRATS